ncbi:MAG: PIN domain-containing protein [Anaerolineae bacterium]|uniref:type II toxin-antitoxin system VapC family toxin n=1 Tax=Thermoflexus sp. TaxID=1969742 RepID=UPI0025CFF20C|nr:PIN domain-containing protein [Thermoflexus sp.]MCS7350620.1 PIN domain-containing protein [Thermoflexus sp.]MDW8180071.1 PIN domain-containing protein [Anaerolineae bacterium]
MDASVWVSRLVPQDVHYEASRRWLEVRVAAGDLLVAPVLLLAEVAGAIARRTGAPELGHRAVEGLLRVPNLRLVSLDRRLGRKMARLAADLRLRGADAAYVALAVHLGLPLVTWDQEQALRVALRIPVLTPDQDP